jgi:hypothetical protein
VPLLVVGRRGELSHADVPWVERFDQASDGAALPAGVPSLEDHQQWRPDGATELTAEEKPEPQHPLLGTLQPLGGVLVAQAIGRVDVSEPRHSDMLAPSGQADLNGSVENRFS